MLDLLQGIFLVASATLLLHTGTVDGYDEGTQGNHLQFVTLGANGVNDVYLSRSDDGTSSAISIYPSINFGSSRFSSAYVSVNGFISFAYSEGIAAVSTTPFFAGSSDDYVIAPFWADADTSSTGQVRYEVHNEYSPYSSSRQLRSQIGTYITDVTGESAYVSSLLVVEWRDVPEFSSSHPTNTNTFQALVATTSSSRSYAIFTYTCGDLSWSKSSAVIGFKASNSLYRNHPLSRNISEINPIACINEPANAWSNVVYRIDSGAEICSPYQFGCTDGTCVYYSSRCNGVHECRDGSDEIGCTPAAYCSMYQHQCVSGSQCVSKTALCNGYNDCRDGSDESGCSPTDSHNTSPSVGTIVGILLASVTVLTIMCALIIGVVMRHYKQRTVRRARFQQLTTLPTTQPPPPPQTQTLYFQPKPGEWYRTIEGHMVQGPPPAYSDDNASEGTSLDVQGAGFQMDIGASAVRLIVPGSPGPAPPFTTTDNTVPSQTVELVDTTPFLVTPERHESPLQDPPTDNEVGGALSNEGVGADTLEQESPEVSGEYGDEDMPLIES